MEGCGMELVIVFLEDEIVFWNLEIVRKFVF